MTWTPTPEELKAILDAHAKWVEDEGQDGAKRANLEDANLYGANLYGANLYGANLRGANLEDANLRGANLYGASLYGANLYGANLEDASLYGANLEGANLRGANLEDANLHGATKISPETRLPTGETWHTYLTEVVPALLTAGGRALDEVATSETWACHTWQNCPMAEAFRVHDLNKIPALLRPRANQFIQFFDAGLIPRPTPKPQEASQ